MDGRQPIDVGMSYYKRKGSRSVNLTSHLRAM